MAARADGVARRPAGLSGGVVAGGGDCYTGAMKARIHVKLKPGVLDPQGKAIGNALKGLGFGGIDEVRQGKLIELDLVDTDPEAARARLEAMCRQLLANPVVEDYAIELG